jgi:hypothetical protein
VIAPTSVENMGGSGNGPPISFDGCAGAASAAATFFTNVTRCLVVPADQADRLTDLMTPAKLRVVRILACRRGSTMVAYSSLLLLVAIAAITLMGHTDSDSSGAPHHHPVGTLSSN